MTATCPLNCESDDRPRSLRDASLCRQRREMLGLPHIAPLTALAAGLRGHATPVVPDFDPLDGGIEAQALFLFEKPGPMAAGSGERPGSGFISRNNDDATAHATFEFMRQAGIPRKLTVIWNLIPAWNGTRTVTTQEVRHGVESVVELVKLLPQLSVVVMVGRSAGRAKPYLATTDLALIHSYHPSPIVKAASRQKWEMIPLQWAKVMTIVERSLRPAVAGAASRPPVSREGNQSVAPAALPRVDENER